MAARSLLTYYCVVGMHPTGMLSCYCPQMKLAKVMFSQVSVCPWGGGACMAGGAFVAGGMHSRGGGVHSCLT